MGFFGVLLLFFRKHYRSNFTNSDSNTHAKPNSDTNSNRHSHAKPNTNSHCNAHTDSGIGNRVY